MGALASWWRRLVASGYTGRVTGRPTSSNGASSFHLRWLADEPAAQVAVTLEVVRPPAVDSLYFWALQADFGSSAGARAGGAHLGLQWHPGHPGSRAVNWGGYDERGSELEGSESGLPSTMHNVNTRDLLWEASVPYRLAITRAPADAQPPAGVATAWRATVTDLRTGRDTVVRDLYPSGDRIVSVVMWSEVFARCDDPPAAIRWTDPVLTALDGTQVVPRGYAVNYQSHGDGGCANSDSSVDGVGVVQRTAVPRTSPQGSTLPVR